MDPPDYAEAQFEQLRLNLAQAMGLTEQEAVAQLTAMWRQRNPLAQQNGPPVAPPQPPNNPPVPTAPAPNPPVPVERKKGAPQIQENVYLSSSRIPDPSEHALRRLRNFEHVELWYFTPKGCEAAASHAVTLEADTFTITKADSTLTLLPSRTSAVPKGHIIQDQHLSYSEMSIAKNNLIAHMAKCHWPPQLVQKFMDFFINRGTHPLRSQPQGEQALLIYQAEARRDWYRDFAASNDNKTFDIAGIVESRLRQIADDIRISTHNQLIADMMRAADPGSSSSQHRSRHPTRRQRSPSHSPPRKRSRRQRSPSPHSPDNSRARGRKSFRASSTSPRSKPTPLSVCPTCLGRNPHAVAHCKATRRWDGLDSNRCTRTDKGHLKDPDGTILCTDWQKPRSCSDTSAGHAPKHQCSGCGDRDHGAQGCPRAQKA